MKNNRLRVAIRVDASNIIGSGHIVRCVTLANALHNASCDVLFISREHTGHMIQKLQEGVHQVHSLTSPNERYIITESDCSTWLGASQEQDAFETLKALEDQHYDLMIVDHYAIDATWERMIRTQVRHTFVIDDLANRYHECDFLLDQNYFGDKTQHRYSDKLPSTCISLLGPSYALLQPEYSLLRSTLPPRDGFVRRVLVFFGGCDLKNNTARALFALMSLDLTDLNVDVVIGVNHPDPDGLREIGKQMPNVIFHQNLGSLADLMANTDLFIGAGGATTWERMALGLPSLVMSVAANQDGFTNALVTDKFQYSLPSVRNVLCSEWQTAILNILQKPIENALLSQRASELVDGLGAKRVVETISHIKSPLVKKNYGSLKISILCDIDSWFSGMVDELSRQWISDGHNVVCVSQPSNLEKGDVCFILSCSTIIKPEQMVLHRHNLVVHAANLPNGRGWSPMTWQIIEGQNRICMTLFEAAAEVDAGPIYEQHWLQLNGTELVDEWRRKQAAVTKQLCLQWIATYPASALLARNQQGKPSYYPRRRIQDSQLDIDKSIREQFNLLRVVDNQRYPAFFEVNGIRYKISIDKVSEREE